MSALEQAAYQARIALIPSKQQRFAETHMWPLLVGSNRREVRVWVIRDRLSVSVDDENDWRRR
jgi:hypothetical protein